MSRNPLSKLPPITLPKCFLTSLFMGASQWVCLCEKYHSTELPEITKLTDLSNVCTCISEELQQPYELNYIHNLQERAARRSPVNIIFHCIWLARSRKGHVLPCAQGDHSKSEKHEQRNIKVQTETLCKESSRIFQKYSAELQMPPIREYHRQSSKSQYQEQKPEEYSQSTVVLPCSELETVYGNELERIVKDIIKKSRLQRSGLIHTTRLGTQWVTHRWMTPTNTANNSESLMISKKLRNFHLSDRFIFSMRLSLTVLLVGRQNPPSLFVSECVS
jgi:hypothetical protein